MKKIDFDPNELGAEIQELDDGQLEGVGAASESLDGSFNVYMCINTGDCCDSTNVWECYPA